MDMGLGLAYTLQRHYVGFVEGKLRIHLTLTHDWQTPRP